MTARKNFGRTTLAREMYYDKLREKNIKRAEIKAFIQTREALEDIAVIESRQLAYKGGVCTENLPMPPVYRRR